jgi:hypothetical protein
MCKNNKDHCGPTVVNFKTWLLSWLVPDNLWGVYIGDLCKLHDDAYAEGGNEEDKDNADYLFSEAIEIRVLSALTKTRMSWKKAYRKAQAAGKLYYLGVHIGGKEHFNYHD